MKVLLAGGTGFLGSALVRALRQRGHSVTVLSRTPKGPGEALWSADASDASLQARVDGADAVINLAGSSIAAGRWTESRKATILRSRVDATRALAGAIVAAPHPPPVFLSGSAVGFYGVQDDTPLDETSPAGGDFLARVCVEWEASAVAAAGHSRVVLLRTGLVLDRNGGALPAMARPFRLGLGGPLGTGQQYMSWIYLHDWVGLVLWTLERDHVVGPLNLTAPAPVTNHEFSRVLANELHRPAALRAPAPVLRLVLGEMADALLLGGQRVLPRKAEAEGFTFRFGHLSPVLHALYG
ncbi:MAG TPA: TIGR01777 family oxidoreductase [Vicinamibacterales bacterium]